MAALRRINDIEKLLGRPWTNSLWPLSERQRLPKQPLAKTPREKIPRQRSASGFPNPARRPSLFYHPTQQEKVAAAAAKTNTAQVVDAAEPDPRNKRKQPPRRHRQRRQAQTAEPVPGRSQFHQRSKPTAAPPAAAAAVVLRALTQKTQKTDPENAALFVFDRAQCLLFDMVYSRI